MASVQEPTPTCKALIAELYGDTLTATDTRQAWRSAVATVADNAKSALPQANGRIDKAVALVLAGDVTLHDDGTATIASQSDPERGYYVNGECDCKDFAKAPHNHMCKHRIARGIAMRATALVQAQHETIASPIVSQPTALALPEAPCSINCHVIVNGVPVQVTLRGTDEMAVLQRLTAVLAQYPAQVPPQADVRTCPVHQVTMRKNEKNGNVWYSHKTPDGWCKGR